MSAEQYSREDAAAPAARPAPVLQALGQES